MTTLSEPPNGPQSTVRAVSVPLEETLWQLATRLPQADPARPVRALEIGRFIHRNIGNESDTLVYIGGKELTGGQEAKDKGVASQDIIYSRHSCVIEGVRYLGIAVGEFNPNRNLEMVDVLPACIGWQYPAAYQRVGATLDNLAESASQPNPERCSYSAKDGWF